MSDFEFYIADDRSSALEFRTIIVRDWSRAHDYAQAVLLESPHYTGVEVRLASRRVFGIGSLSDESSRQGADWSGVSELKRRRLSRGH